MCTCDWRASHFEATRDGRPSWAGRPTGPDPAGVVTWDGLRVSALAGRDKPMTLEVP